MIPGLSWRRRTVDRLTARVVGLGGGAIIGAITLIFFFLLLVAAPIFRRRKSANSKSCAFPAIGFWPWASTTASSRST